MTKEMILDYLLQIKPLLQKDGIEQIALFGSFARGENGVYSDIDLAIKKETNYLLTRSAYDYFDEVKKIQGLLPEKFHRNSDIFDLDSGSSMKDSIEKDLIYV